ncbi:MAG: DoxX family protein [Bacteroidota bacterium]
MRLFLENLIKPVVQDKWLSDLILAIPRMVYGALLAFSFGASKFGMPWTPEASDLQLFEVSDWFVEDVATFGGMFALAPLFFAWLGAASEAIGGLFLILGLNTRISSLLLLGTMVVAIFFQQWDNGLWAMLPALGFLWVALFGFILGSGRFGLDYLISKKIESNRLLKATLE